MTQEEAFWAEIGRHPDDQLPRLVFADWLEENAKDHPCGCEDGSIDSGGWTPWGDPVSVMCGVCDGTGRVSNGYAELAAALRATADRHPQKKHVAGGVPRDGAARRVRLAPVRVREGNPGIIRRVVDTTNPECNIPA